MKILFLSCHSILEYDEVKLFTELGHQVFALGAYQNPNAPQDTKRPAINGFYSDQLQSVAIQTSKDDLHSELIEWADVIYIMHRSDWIIKNWPKIKHKKVIWRTIGQSIPDTESALAFPRIEGLKIVRYSPAEENIKGYIGHDAVIRFYKDENEFSGWTGKNAQIITVAQSMKAREKYCGYDIFNNVTQNYPRSLYGPNNEDSGIQGGLLTYDGLKEAYRDNRAYFYTGTYPASYTLNFIEALMTGIPIVAIGKALADLGIFKMETYEVHKILEHKVNGFCSNEIDELRGNIDYLLQHKDKAEEISKKGRQTAIELFGKEVIRDQWKRFFENI